MSHKHSIRTIVINEFIILFNDKKIAKNLEIGVFNYTILYFESRNIKSQWKLDKFITIYKHKAESLLKNIKNQSSQELFNSILTKNYNYSQLCYEKQYDIHFNNYRFGMNPMDIDITKWDDILKRDNERCRELDDKIKKEDGLYTCKFCKSKKTTFTLVQTRSGDEAMTVMVKCLECNNEFRGG